MTSIIARALGRIHVAVGEAVTLTCFKSGKNLVDSFERVNPFANGLAMYGGDLCHLTCAP